MTVTPTAYPEPAPPTPRRGVDQSDFPLADVQESVIEEAARFGGQLP